VPECKACHLEGKRESDRAYHAANREDIAARQHADWKASQERKQAVLREAGYIPASEAQERLGVSRQFVSNLAARGKIERHPSRRGWYDAASVDRYLEERDT
jgi:predicted transcriptional regulator of viral defense system